MMTIMIRVVVVVVLLMVGITGEGTLSDLGLEALAKSRAGGHLGHLGGGDAGSHCDDVD